MRHWRTNLGPLKLEAALRILNTVRPVYLFMFRMLVFGAASAYGNYVYIPQLWKIQVSLFGHYAFEGPSTSTGIKSGTSNSRCLLSSPAETLAVLWQNSTCMASVAARGAQNIHSEVMRKLANLLYIEATRCSRSTPTSKALRPQWAVGGAGKGGSGTIKKSKAGKTECWQKGRHLN
ncbi:unnamed protein product [Musa acuminata subsp. burmannicoides]